MIRKVSVALVGFLFLLPRERGGFPSPWESSQLLETSVAFQKISHQNPWTVGESFSKKSKAVPLGKGLFFTVTANQQKPLFVSFDALDYGTARLRILSYDPETGFLLFQSQEPERWKTSLVWDPVSEKKFCPKGKTRYIQFPFSETSVKATLLERKDWDEVSLHVQGNVLCGILTPDGLVGLEYIRAFVQAGETFPGSMHPGFVFETNPTPSEKAYYFGEGQEGILVSEVFPGIGPAYALFPGDAILSINGESLDRVPEWDKRDRILDLILRDPQGRLKPPGSKVHLVVYRHRKKIPVSYELQSYKTKAFLIPEEANGMRPLYYIEGGFFFTELTGSYLKEFGAEYRAKSDRRLLFLFDFFQKKSHPIREKVVILSRVFSVEGNAGYHEFQDLVLQTVNGDRITSLFQLKRKIEESDAKYIAMEFSGGKLAVFSRADLRQIREQVLTTYRISRLQNLDD